MTRSPTPRAPDRAPADRPDAAARPPRSWLAIDRLWTRSPLLRWVDRSLPARILAALVLGHSIFFGVNRAEHWFKREPVCGAGDSASDCVGRQLGDIVATDNVEALGILVVAALYLLESRERQKRTHYEAWRTIDSAAAAGVTTSYARLRALEDLNRDGIPLEGLELGQANLKRIDLRQAALPEARLHETNLSEANLSGADLHRADLMSANLQQANLRGADLSGALLDRADLRQADLRGARLNGAILRNTKLDAVDLAQADLREANLLGTRLDRQQRAIAVRHGARVDPHLATPAPRPRATPAPPDSPANPKVP